MGEIVAVLPLHALEALLHARAAAEEGRVGVLDLLNELQSPFKTWRSGSAAGLGVEIHELAHGGGSRPARQAVVGDIDEATDLQFASDEVDDRLAVLLAIQL